MYSSSGAIPGYSVRRIMSITIGKWSVTLSKQVAFSLLCFAVLIGACVLSILNG